MNNTDRLRLKTKRFFSDYYGWILLIVGITALVLLTDFDNFIIDLIRMYKESVVENNQNKSNLYSLGFYVSTILQILLVVVLTVIVFIGLGNFFYLLFFKYILQKTNAVYIIDFIICLLVFYSLFWEVMQWTFVKNNMLEMSYFYDGKEINRLARHQPIGGELQQGQAP